MTSAIALLLAALGGSTVAAIILVAILVQHPEKIQLWAAWIWKGLRAVTRRAEYRYVAADVAGHVNDRLARDLGANIDGLGVPMVAIKWTNDATAVASLAAGTLIVRMRPHEDRVSNLLHASLAATQRIVAPTLRPQLLPAQSKAIDLQLCRRLAEHLSNTAVTEYRLDILQPALEATPGLDEILTRLNAIDLGGLFLPVLLQELTKLATASPIDTLPGLAENLRRFTEFLLGVAQRGSGEDVQLSYQGAYFRVNILLVARMETRVKGVGPYRARVGSELARNIETFYVMATETNISFAKEVADALDADRRLIRGKTKSFLIERAGKRVTAVLIPFERNTGFATAEFFRQVVAANKLRVGTRVPAIVTDVQPAYVVVDVSGAQGVIHIADLAWHWVHDATREVQVGDEIEAEVIEILVDRTELRLSRKATLESPLAGYSDEQLIGQQKRFVITRRATDSSNVASVLGHSTDAARIPLRMYWEEYAWGEDPSSLERLEVGQELAVIIIKVERATGNAVCSHKRLAGDKWEVIRDKYPRGRELTLPVAAVVDNGVLCDVEAGLVGYIPDSEFRQAGLEYSDYQIRLHPGDILYVYVSRAVGGARERLNLGLQRNRDRSRS